MSSLFRPEHESARAREKEMNKRSPAREVVTVCSCPAFDAYLSILRDRGVIGSRSAFVFAHNAKYRIGPGHPLLISSYHPSQQNTSTGKLTEKMLLDVFRRARRA